jgi:hypothetical protein
VHGFIALFVSVGAEKQLLAASFQLLACGSEGWGSVVSHPSHKYKSVARVGHPQCVGEPRMGTRQPVAGISALPGKGRLRSEVSQVPKCEAGAPAFIGCTRFSRHLGHPPEKQLLAASF